MQTSAPFVLPRSAAEGISQTLWDGTFCTMHIKKGNNRSHSLIYLCFSSIHRIPQRLVPVDHPAKRP